MAAFAGKTQSDYDAYVISRFIDARACAAKHGALVEAVIARDTIERETK